MNQCCILTYSIFRKVQCSHHHLISNAYPPVTKERCGDRTAQILPQSLSRWAEVVS